MFQASAKIFSLGDGALTVEFGDRISLETNDFVLKLAEAIKKKPFPGFIEIVPAYSSLTVFYEAFEARKNLSKFKTADEKVSHYINEIIAGLCESAAAALPPSRKIEIPICFDEEFSPDLESVASINSLAPETAVEIFLARTYRVFMLGFLPGFSYLGELDERIAAPRRNEPRLNVPAGSVGIAGRQTGIYSLDSPGGWQIIGRTPLAMFTPKEAIPTILRAGDTVEFYRIDKAEFSNLKTKRHR